MISSIPETERMIERLEGQLLIIGAVGGNGIMLETEGLQLVLSELKCLQAARDMASAPTDFLEEKLGNIEAALEGKL